MSTQVADRAPASFVRSLDGRRAIGVLAVLVAARALLYAAFGAGMVLDDWTFAGNREFLGITEIATEGRFLSRPLEGVTYSAVYGVGGAHPLLLLTLVTFLNVAAVGALYLLLRRYFSALTAFVVGAAWVVVPNHNAMSVWAANSQSVVAFTLLVAGALLLTRGAWVGPAVLLAGSVLAYQLTLPPAVAAAVLIGTRWLPLAPDAAPPRRTLRLLDRAVVLACIGGATAWASAHPTYPIHYFAPSQWVYLSAHFGEGLFAGDVPAGWQLVAEGVALVGLVVSLIAFVRGERGRDQGPVLVLVGGLVMGLGSLAVLTTASQAFGMTDRVYAVTSVGAVMIWVGIGQYLYRHWRVAAYALAVAWCAVCLFGQMVSLRSWSQAGDDVVALLHHLDTIDPDGTTDFVVGPRAVRHNNVTGLVSPNAPDNALWLHRGRQAGSLRIAKTPEEFVIQREGEVLVEWPVEE